MNMLPDDGTSRFWQDFARRAARLADKIKRDLLQDAFTAVEALLKKSGYDFAFELTREDASAVLILTPEGDANEAARIDRLLASRPDIPGWRFYGRRQRKDPDDALVFVRHIYDVDASDAQFTLKQADDKRFDVTMFSNALRGMPDDVRTGLVTTFLHHAVGEEDVMKNVRHIRGADYPLAADSVLTMHDAVRALRSA